MSRRIRATRSGAALFCLAGLAASSAAKTLGRAGDHRRSEDRTVAANTLLSSGVPAPFTLPPVTSAALFAADSGFRMEVPAGATRLEIRLVTSTPRVDVDLYARLANDVTLSGGGAVADHRSDSPGSNEIIAVRPTSSASLPAGTYYIALGLFTTGTAVSGSITATVDTGPTLPVGTLMAPEVQTSFSFSPVTEPLLFNGHYSYGIVVPASATRLEVRLTTTTPDADVDLFVRFGSDVGQSGSAVVAEYRSTGPTGGETITITPSSTPALRAGAYYISLAVFTTGIPISGTLLASLGSAPAPRLEAAPASLDFGAVGVGQNRDLNLAVRNAGSAVLTATSISSSNPLFTAVSPAVPFTVPAGAEQQVVVRFRPAAAGAQTGVLTIASNDPSRPAATIPLAGNGQAASTAATGISASASSLIFSAPSGSNPAPQTFQLTSTGGATASFRASATQSWLAVSPSQGTAGAQPVSLSVSVNSAGLSPQTLAGEIRISIPAADPLSPTQSPVTIVRVALNLTAPTSPTLEVSRRNLIFEAAAGTNPAPKTFEVRNIGAGTLNYSITASQSWLSVTPARGASTGQAEVVTVAVNASGLAAHTYTGEIRISDGAPASLVPGPAQGAPFVVAVKLVVSPPAPTGGGGETGGAGSGGGGGPAIAQNGVVNAASFLAPSQPGGAIAQGSVFSIFGANLGPPVLATVTAFPLPRTLGGVSIRVSRGQTSVQAIPLAVVATQANAILPSNAPLGEASITVTFNGQTSAPVPVQIVPASFGAFTLNSSGSGQGIVQNFVSATDQPLNSPARPASPSQVLILWGTGLGAISAADDLGPPAGDLPAPLRILVGNRPVTEKLYGGRTPCCSGIDQIAFRLPFDAPSGCAVPLQVYAGETPSNVVTIAIAPCTP